MVTVQCDTNECPNSDTPFFILGSPEQVMCGGCQTMLMPYDQVDDPENNERFMNE